MLRIQIRFRDQKWDFEHRDGSFFIGRVANPNRMPRHDIPADQYLSGDHVEIQAIAGGRVRVRNLSSRNKVTILGDEGSRRDLSTLTEESNLAPNAAREMDSPVRLSAGQTRIDVEAEEAAGPLETVASPVGFVVPNPSQGSQSLQELGLSPTPEKLAHWLETVIAVQRSAAGSPEFYQQTARAVVELVGLDKGLVLLRRLGRWMVQARWPEDSGDMLGREFSTSIVAKVEKERRTFYQAEGSAASSSESLQNITAVVASPVVDSREQVVGIVYGCRNRYARHRGGIAIGPLDAQVVQLLASTVGVAQARLEQEAEAGRLRVQFEQFFSADLARELRANPRLLEGQQRVITVLFSDIRGFSRASEKLGPLDTCNLVSYVMERLTQRIREQDGVVVDYSGDGIMAMWNAPATQEDHAAKACKAALAMLSDLPSMDADWHQRLEGPLKLGIGLNTGPALVGNTGSTQKFKYGPLGHAVNLASRVEGATKAMGVPLLITGSTREHLGPEFATRRLCKVRVVGIKGAVDLFELVPQATASPEWCERCTAYETALQQYEAGNFQAAGHAMYKLLAAQDDYHDVPSLSLTARAVAALQAPPPEPFDGVVELSSK